MRLLLFHNYYLLYYLSSRIYIIILRCVALLFSNINTTTLRALKRLQFIYLEFSPIHLLVDTRSVTFRTVLLINTGRIII